jgi:parallel beta-helix repeat protein
MNRTILVIGIIFLLVGVSVIPSTVGIIDKKTTIGYLISRGFIQDLIDNASDGDTIYIPSGTYYEHIVIDKSISLIGEDKHTTIIDGNDTFGGSAITIQKDNVTVTNFTIQKGRTYGVKIYTSYNTISNNIITQNNYGIDIYGDFITIKDNLIYNNQIINNSRGSIDINHWVKRTTISHNVIKNSPESVDFDKTENIISYNIIENASNIEFFQASNNLVENNVIISGLIELHDSSLIKIKNNTFFDSRGIVIKGEDIDEWDTHTIENNSINGKSIYFYKHASGYTIPSDAGGVILVGCTQFAINNIVFPEKAGIQLAYSSSNIINGNTITKTNWMESAIYLQASSNNNLSHNTVSSCEEGIYLDSDSSNNLMYKNIIKNNKEVGILCVGSSNTFIENHIADNFFGMQLVGASDTIIRKNNFIDNRFHASFFLGYSYKHSNKWQSNFYSRQVPRLIKIIFGAIKTPFYYMVYPPDMPPYKQYISRPGFNVDWSPAKQPYNYTITQGCGI